MSEDTPAATTPPGPAGHPLLGCLNDFRLEPLRFLEACARDYGDAVSFRMMHMKGYLFVHPEQIREVLLDSEGALVKGMALDGFRPLIGRGLLLNEGEDHRRQRRLMQPAFHRARVETYAEAMVRHGEAAASSWEHGQRMDLAAALSALTLDIAAETLFGADLSGEESAQVAAAMSSFAAWYHRTQHPLGPLLQRLPTRISRDFKAGKGDLAAIVDRLIAARREGGDRGDILSMLVFARDEQDGRAMSEDHIRDEAVTLLIAGHETTAAALTWAVWLLSRHPEALARVEAEVDALEGPPTLAELPRLAYCRGVLGEALRLYPPSFALPRQAVKPLTIGGWRIPAGALVMTSPWVTHRDPRWWPEPLAFKPERWAPEAKGDRPRHAFIAFGGGARVCIGEAFAWMEGTLLLATLLRRWRLRPDATEPPPLDTTFTLRPDGGLPGCVEARNH